MGVVLVIAVTWLFLFALALAILRSAGQAERAAERQLRARAAKRRRSEARRRTATTALMVAAIPVAGAAVAPADADAQSCKARKLLPGQTLCLINQERRARGLAPLDGNVKLGRAATRHATDMIRRAYFAHDSPEGTSFFERLRRTGYARGCSSWGGGETLAWAFGSQASPASRVAAWMQSPPHRAVLLGRSYREAGIAVVNGSPGNRGRGLTYVGEFGRRRC